MRGLRPDYLMDALYFLKVYPTESMSSAFSGRDEKTVRQWNWRIIIAIADLADVVSKN